MSLSTLLFVVLSFACRLVSAGGDQSKVYGVNLGSWSLLVSELIQVWCADLLPRRLLLEPWMLPEGHYTDSKTPVHRLRSNKMFSEWQAMGGQICDDCSSCIASELYVNAQSCENYLALGKIQRVCESVP